MTLTDRTTRIPAHGTRDLDEKKRENNDDVLDVGDTGSLPPTYDHTHRKLKARHIQLIGIGGTIGTALYVQIGKALIKGGPGSLLIAFTLWCFVILCVNNCVAEMVTYIPISSPFIRFAGRFVDEAFGVAAGYNFFIFEAAMVPFEIVACTTILRYWPGTTPLPDGAIIAICIFLYACINIGAVRYYGESEFWLALGKMVLIVGLICFVFITMLGGNPQHDRFGFRYWKDPGSFAEYYTTGNTGRFLGFLACLIQATFTIAGPEYVSMAAGEAERPRTIMPRAYKSVFFRLSFFFVLGSLAVGIIVPYDNKELAEAYSSSKPGAAASPYVVAMDLLNIPVLPHIVNALILSSAFSAGNSYVYCASRCLMGLALDGKAPKILAKCTRTGVPLYSVGVVLLIALLSFLQVSNGSAVVLSWIVSLVTASQLINFSVMSFTFLRFRAALKAQGITPASLPHTSFWQPYTAYLALAMTTLMTLVGGYEVFLNGNWDIPTFLFSYTMVVVFPLLFIGWKLVKRTEWRRPETVNIFAEEKDQIDEYEANYAYVPPSNMVVRYWDNIWS